MRLQDLTPFLVEQRGEEGLGSPSRVAAGASCGLVQLGERGRDDGAITCDAQKRDEGPTLWSPSWVEQMVAQWNLGGDAPGARTTEDGAGEQWFLTPLSVPIRLWSRFASA